MNTFRNLYKKVGDNGNESDYELISTIGIEGIPLSIMQGATKESNGEIGVVPKPMKGEERSLLTGAGTWETINTIIGNNDDITIPSTEEFGDDMPLVVKYLVDNKLIEMGKFFVCGFTYRTRRSIIGRFYRDEDGSLFGSCMILGYNPGSSKIVCCDHEQYTAYELLR